MHGDSVEADRDGSTDRLRVEIAGPGLGAAAAAAVAEGAAVAGVDDVAALAAVVRDLCDQIVDKSFDLPDDARLAVSVAAIDHRVVVRIDDRGRPGGHHDVDIGPDSQLGRRRGLAEAVHLSGRGRHGNRIELVLRPGRGDLRTAGVATPRSGDPVPADEPVTIRFAEPSDAEGIALCVYECYGYSYEVDWLYEPDAIAARLEAHTLRSAVGASSDGEIVGHLGLSFDSVRDRVGEAGMAVVDPRWRGHHLFTSLKRHMARWAADVGLAGMFSEATAAHPYSQRANLDLGAVETGLLVGYIPTGVGYVGIETAPHRQSVALFYLRTGEGPDRAIHTPPHHRAMLREIVQRAGLVGRLVDDVAAPTGASSLHVVRRPDHDQATILVEVPGADTVDVVGPLLRRLCVERVDTVYADLPLSQPGTAHAAASLEDLGFSFGGIFPNRRVDGDVLRLQYLNNVDPHTDDIVVASEFGERLRAYVLDELRV